MRIGVYVCHCGMNIAATVDVEKVVEFAERLPNVVVARHYQYMCSDPGQELIKRGIKEFELDRVVVAACSPRMHEPTFRTLLKENGLNPYCFEMTNIREQCSWVHGDKEGATKKAIDLIRGSVARASLLDALDSVKADVTPKALVIGGGIAGIQAALDIGDAGFEVYLVERELSIGGHMAQFDKTFPTLDCSACILTPKMVDLAHHSKIRLITYAEVTDVEGYVGNFKAKIRKKPRYVDEERCTGCGSCIEECPAVIPDEFNLGFGTRKAIYLHFPQAVPFVCTIDMERCIECKLCERICEADAIDFDQKEEEIEVNVGAIIVATGYETFDPSKKAEYGYGIYENVITGLEFERLSCASGPTGGKIIIDGEVPREIVFISCVGSRDREGNKYCSRVCCMYTAKHAHLIREKIPDANVTVLYTDMRAFGKGFEEFYNRVKDEGVVYKRRELDDEIEIRSEGERLIVRSGNDRMRADLVILATGMVPRGNAKSITKMLRISQKESGFFLEVHPKLRPVDTFTDGVFLAGCCQFPKDIPDTIAQASAAASMACNILCKRYAEAECAIASVDETICRGCGVCEETCEYGAIELKERWPMVLTAEVIAQKCKGCGACAVACSNKAITMRHSRDDQMFAMIKTMMTSNV
jgi:heterodisulfide reductase subunit A